MTETTELARRAEVLNVREVRNFALQGAELRSVPNGTGGSDLNFLGYACATDKPYEMQDWMGEWAETVRSGAFKKTLTESADVSFLINHEGLTLARTKSKTMTLSEDASGLYTEARLDPKSPHVQGLQSAMERNDVDEMSMAFRVTRQEWNEDYTTRDILEVNLDKGDVSAVNYGANPYTSASLRSLRHDLPSIDRIVERYVAALKEVRAGKALSADTMSVLSQVLDFVADADENLDEAQEVLSNLMGVANPDDDDVSDPADEPAASEAKSFDFSTFKARAEASALRI